MALWYRCCNRIIPAPMWGLKQAAIGSQTAWLSYSIAKQVTGEHMRRRGKEKKEKKYNKRCNGKTEKTQKNFFNSTWSRFVFLASFAGQTGLTKQTHDCASCVTVHPLCCYTGCWHFLGQTLADRAADCRLAITLNTSNAARWKRFHNCILY